MQLRRGHRLWFAIVGGLMFIFKTGLEGTTQADCDDYATITASKVGILYGSVKVSSMEVIAFPA